MKVKKTAKCPASASIDSTKVIKKKNKKKVKSLVQKLSTNSEVTEMVEPASGVAATTLSPKNNKRKKKNKNKKNKSEKPVDNGSIGSSSNSKELQVNNKSINSKNPLDNTLKVSNTHPATDNTSTDAPPKTKKAQKKNKRANSQASAGNASAAKDKKRRRAKTKESGIPESNEEKEQRTIFVGNVSTTTTRKNLARFFSKYGKVEAVRLRCAAVPTPGTPKRQAIITNKFHEKRSSLSAYVRFTEKAMVEAALKANGAQLDQKHLHVDSSQGCTDRNTKLAVFIGNLAFEAEEETLRSHFASCGEIESVRIVRDNKMASGKGFGYVNFVSEDAVEMALQLDGQVFMHRQLRVQRCTKQGKKRSKPSFKTQGKKGLGFMKTKQTSPKSKKMQQSFAGKKMVETKKFKKMRAKAKFTKEDRKKKSIAHKLAGVK